MVQPPPDNAGRPPVQNQTDATDVRNERPAPDKRTAAEYPPVARSGAGSRPMAGEREGCPPDDDQGDPA